MLPSKNRLKLSGPSALGGKKVENDELTLIGKAETDTLKAAIVVAKKVAKKAVDRNRIRRVISESIRTNLETLKFKGSVIIIVKKNLAALKKEQMEEKLLKLFKKL